ncbi:zona pellucida sperm-binding protein 3 [Sebastes umbrosus]|uniref:zona pellucida sperm-binding protein 3 n=1 Tax=Sebastes umbrosus TaxID=72105 RepID=UPI00189F2414|nr:zona pellucida sperm-binding protein 3 [Sebastes umbrosus]
MKTKWRLYILWSVLSLGLLSCVADTYESPFTRTTRKQVIKPIRQPSKSSQRFFSPAGTPPLSQLIHTPPSMRPEPKIQSDFAYLPDVSVTCSTPDLVVRVKPSFYGLGAGAEELKLGNSCHSNGVLRPYGDLLFTYPLTACDVVRESPRGYLLYKFVLHYEPSPKRFPSRAQRIDVDIECRYQRNHHVYQLTVKPTWETAVVRKRLKGSPNDFQMELMDDSWSRPAKSQVYQLGRTVNFQVSAPHLLTGGKLYINTCYAKPSSGSESSLKYTIIDKFGCMLDSKSDPGASQFISRTDNTLRFSLKAFQFTSDPDTEVSVHCKLFVTSEDPGPAHKSCTYRGNRWKALTGDDSVCECCDSQCVTSKPRRAMMEGSASSGSLLVSDQPYTAEDGFLPVIMSREGEVTVNHSHENLWESADAVKYDDDDEEQDYADEEEEKQQLEEAEEESGFILGVMTEPDLDELGFRERVSMEEKESGVKDSDQFEEDGSGYEVLEESDEEEEGFEGREDEIHLNQKEAEVLRHWVQLEQMFPSGVGIQRELKPLVSEGNRKHTGRGEEDDGVMASEVERENDDGEMTWYFPWR